MNANKTCPVCSSEKITNFLNREQVPVHQNMVFKSQEVAISAHRGNLKLVCCKDCGFIFNQSFELAMLDYGNWYDNTQHCSPSFDKYLEKLSHYLIVEKGPRNCLELFGTPLLCEKQAMQEFTKPFTLAPRTFVYC